MAGKAHLGKGLGAIFGADINGVIEEIQQGKVDIGGWKNEILVSEIRPNPYQPRKEFDLAKINELADSIKVHGVFQPILVRKSVSGYDLVAGERRLRASKIAGLEKIPAIITEFNDEQMMEISLLENIQRENLNVVEESIAYQRLIDNIGYTQAELAKQIGKSRTYITNTLRLLKLPEEVLELLKEDKLQMGHARCLITIEDEDKTIALAKEIVAKHLSVRDAERLAKNSISKPTKANAKPKDGFIINLENSLKSKLQTNVEISSKSIKINYSDINDLNRILEILDCLED